MAKVKDGPAILLKPQGQQLGRALTSALADAWPIWRCLGEAIVLRAPLQSGLAQKMCKKISKTKPRSLLLSVNRCEIGTKQSQSRGGKLLSHREPFSASKTRRRSATVNSSARTLPLRPRLRTASRTASAG